jgi:hypothetical protein
MSVGVPIAPNKTFHSGEALQIVGAFLFVIGMLGSFASCSDDPTAHVAGSIAIFVMLLGFAVYLAGKLIR